MVNKKRVHRWYRLEGLQLRMRVRRRKHMYVPAPRACAAGAAHASAKIEAWRIDYNAHRPTAHSAT